MITVAGGPCPITATSGSRTLPWLDGLLIATATGFGSLPGDGLGLTMSLGASHLSTTDAGLSFAAYGAGCPARQDRQWVKELRVGRATRPRSWPGCAARASPLALAL